RAHPQARRLAEAVVGEDGVERVLDLLDGHDRLTAARWVAEDSIAEHVERAGHARADLSRAEQFPVLGRRRGERTDAASGPSSRQAGIQQSTEISGVGEL